MFDRYIGLGLNCEVYHQLRRVSGDPRANVFDWQRFTNRALANVLSADFETYFRLENLRIDASDRVFVLDGATGVEFHHAFTQNLDGTIFLPRVHREYPKARARAEHLIRRWRETVRSDASVLYVRRDHLDQLTAQDLLELRDLLREHCPNHRFAVLWLRIPQAPGAPAVSEGVSDLDERVFVASAELGEPERFGWYGDDAVWDRLYPHLRELSYDRSAARAGRG